MNPLDTGKTMTHILIIDDSPTERHVLQGYLHKHGFKTSTAQTAEEGLEMARSLKPDLILMDVVMPGMNGFQATRALAKDASTGTIPIILVTTKDQETDRIWGMRQGAKDYLTKPVTEDALLKSVQNLLKA